MNRFRFTFIIFLLIGSNVLAKEKKVKKSINHLINEEYFFNKKLKKKNGDYFVIHRLESDTLVKGKYANGIKVGNWAYKNGKAFFSYNFETGQIIENSVSCIDSCYVRIQGRYVLKKVSQFPLLLDFESAFEMHLNRNIRLPRNYYSSDISSKNVFSYIISDKGKIISAKAESCQDSNLSAQVVKAIKSFDKEFLPAKTNDKKVFSRMLLLLEINTHIDNITAIRNKPYVNHVVIVH